MVKKQKRKTKSELRDETRQRKIDFYKDLSKKAEAKLFNILDPNRFVQVFVKQPFLGEKLRSYLCQCDIASMAQTFVNFRGNPGLECPHCSSITGSTYYLHMTKPSHHGGYKPVDDTARYYQSIYMRIVNDDFVPWRFPDEISKRQPTHTWGWRIPKGHIYSQNERNGKAIETWRDIDLWEVGPNQLLTHLIAPLSVWLKILQRQLTNLETPPRRCNVDWPFY